MDTLWRQETHGHKKAQDSQKVFVNLVPLCGYFGSVRTATAIAVESRGQAEYW